MISGRGVPWAAIRSAAASRDRARLHAEQAGDLDAEADAAQAEHRVLLVEPADVREQRRGVLVDLAALLGEGDLDAELGEVGQELVQRRVEQPDGHRAGRPSPRGSR